MKLVIQALVVACVGHGQQNVFTSNHLHSVKVRTATHWEEKVTRARVAVVFRFPIGR